MESRIDELILSDEIIEHVNLEAAGMLKELLKDDLVEVILYGSCARGDYTDDSDIDIAVITRCDRLEAKKYNDGLAKIATELAMKYFAVVNFVCLPQSEFEQKKTWYAFFRNIASEGKIVERIGAKRR